MIKSINGASFVKQLSFSRLPSRSFQREANSGYFVVLARKCLASTLNYIVTHMRKINREKGYLMQNQLLFHTQTRKALIGLVLVPATLSSG